jgi:cytolysin-activating lysine-acyltransferase
VSEVLGEIVWLISQSLIHKQMFIKDLEWFVMTSVLPQQFRPFYAKDRPVGVVLWGYVSQGVEQRLSKGVAKLRPQDWKSGDRLWVVEVISPFGGAEEMVRDLQEKVFPGRDVKLLKVGACDAVPHQTGKRPAVRALHANTRLRRGDAGTSHLQ